MILRRFACIFIVFSFLFFITNNPGKIIAKSSSTTLASAQEALSSSEFFAENKGQWDSSILFVGDTSFGKVAFAKDAVYYQMVKTANVATADQNNRLSIDSFQDRFKKAPNTYETQMVKLSFVNPHTPTIKGDGLLSHYNNYFIGNNPSKWASYCRNYAKVTYQDVWKGIDLTYFFTSEGMKYEYYVSSEANIQDLQIRVEGANISTAGKSLQITTELGNIMDANLKVFDQTTLRDIPSNFSIQNNVISFQGIPEERKNTIVIDPLVFGSYLGGSEKDQARNIAVDNVGNVIISGGTNSTNFPITQGVIKESLEYGDAAFVTKLNSTGTELIFSTFLGGKARTQQWDSALDLVGNIYVCGYSGDDFPTTEGCFQPKHNGCCDGFIAKLNTTGTELLFSTFIGGSDYEFAIGITVDKETNVYVCGQTQSYDFPLTKDAYQKVNTGMDIFISKVNPTGTKILSSTYLGGFGGQYTEDCISDEPSDIAVDKDGNIYLTGRTCCSNFPITKGVFQEKFKKGWYDAFVSKLNNSCTNLLYSSFLGGSESDQAYNIAIDSDGNAYVCGATRSTDFPITKDAYQSNLKWQNGFISKINSTGTTLLYSTLLGGSEEDEAHDIVLDSFNNAYVTGFSKSSDYPISEDAYQITFKGGWGDAFVTKLNPAGSEVIYSTFVGGSGTDQAFGIDLDVNNNVYICGFTESSNFPTTPKAYRRTLKGEDDAFIAKLDIENKEKFDDTTPPIFVITTPEDNSVTTDSVIHVEGKVYDKESKIALFQVRGENIQIDDYDGSFEFSWDLTDGKNTIELIATNRAKLTTIKILTITRLEPDKIGPTITIYNPLPYASVNESQLTVKGKAVDKESGLQEVLVNRKRVPFNDNGEFETVVILEELENTITIEARDKQDNNSVLSISVKCEPCFKKNYLILELWTGKTKAYIDGKPYTLDAPPMVRLGRTQVPLRFIAEGLKATVNFDAKTQKIVIQSKTTTITMNIDNNRVIVENVSGEIKSSQEIILESAPFIFQGRTMVPVRFVSEVLGAKVDYGSTDRSIVISVKR